jgi:hypothetical protein
MRRGEPWHEVLRMRIGLVARPMQITTILILRCEQRRCGSIVRWRASKDALPLMQASPEIV